MSVPAAPSPTSPDSHGETVLARLTPGKRRLAAIALWGNLLCQMGIIVTGGVVRLSKSGLGCSTWPHCEPGQFTPKYHPELGIKPFIEFGNRTLTGVLVIFAALTLFVAYRYLRAKGRGFLTLAWVPMILTIFQALWGMLVVLLHLHPFFVSVHFVVSPILVAASTVLLYRFYDGDDSVRPAVHRGARLLFWPLAASALAVILVGTVTTGSGPHSGDANAPQRFPFNPAEVAWLHADIVWLLCGLIFGMTIVLVMTKAHKPSRTALWVLVAVTLAQGAIGYSQYFLGLPEVLVGLHMLGAACFSAAVSYLGASLYTWHPVGRGSAPEDHSHEARSAHA